MNDLRTAFMRQAQACTDLGSDFTAILLGQIGERLSDNHPVGAFLFDWPYDSFRSGAVALRLAGALHSLVLLGKDARLAAVYPPHSVPLDTLWQQVDRALREHHAHIIGWMDSAPQTNEIRRCVALIPAFHLVAQTTGLPLVMSEIGASAGLNLNWDRYALEIGGQVWGPPGAKVRLTPDWQGGPPPRVNIEVLAREGCDIKPLAPCKADDRLRMMSYIWPDQALRIANTRQALDMACAAAHVVQREDALAFLTRRLAPVNGATRVIYHTIMWQYLPEADQAKGAAMIAAAGAKATETTPLAWVRAEADGRFDGAAITCTIWPGGEERELGRMDFHGRWVEWYGGD